LHTGARDGRSRRREVVAARIVSSFDALCDLAQTGLDAGELLGHGRRIRNDLRQLGLVSINDATG